MMSNSQMNGDLKDDDPLVIAPGKATVVLGAQWGDEGKGMGLFEKSNSTRQSCRVVSHRDRPGGIGFHSSK